MLFCKRLAAFMLLVAILAPLEARNKQGDTLLAQGHEAEIRKQWEEAQDPLDRMMTVPELKPQVTWRGDLKMNNQPMKVLFETVGKLAGINVVFDPDIPATGTKNLSVEFNGSTVEQAFDYLATVTKS